jgi:N-acetylmuramoyl-L-alanine amidase
MRRIFRGLPIVALAAAWLPVSVGLVASSLAASSFAASGLAAPGAGAPKRACDPAAFAVLLDVGHTAEEPGAISAKGVPEYEFNLNLAKRIEAVLHAAGFTRTTLLLTGGDKRRGLVKRVAAANAAKADLLISIHHDSVPDFLLQHMDEEGGPKRFSGRFSGHSIFVSLDNAKAAASLAFAKFLGQRLKAGGLRYTPHYTEAFMRARRRALLDKEAGVYRFDALYVLRAARMPAVLLEAGLIINPAEEKTLAEAERPQRIAVAVREAAKDFCTARAAPATKPAAAHRP